MENKTKHSIKNTKDKKFAYKVPFVVIYIPAKIMEKPHTGAFDSPLMLFVFACFS